MSNYSQKAVELFKQGYNCSQAVLAAFYEELDIDFETALKISSSFGAGMGGMREVCGAVSGMFMVVGLKYGYTNPKDYNSKAEHYKMIHQLAEQFKEENGSIICRELLGLDKTICNKKRPCHELVQMAAESAENIIKEDENERYCTIGK